MCTESHHIYRLAGISKQPKVIFIYFSSSYHFVAFELQFLVLISFIYLIKIKSMYSPLKSQIHKVFSFLFKKEWYKLKIFVLFLPSLVFEFCSIGLI